MEFIKEEYYIIKGEWGGTYNGSGGYVHTRHSAGEDMVGQVAEHHPVPQRPP